MSVLPRILIVICAFALLQIRLLADQVDPAFSLFTNAESRCEVGYVESWGDWNSKGVKELRFDFRVLHPFENIRLITDNETTVQFGDQRDDWRMGVSAAHKEQEALLVEVVLQNHSADERFILGGGAPDERPFDLVAVGPAGEITLLGGARNLRAPGNWRVVGRSIPSKSEAHWVLQFSVSELKGGTGEYLIYALVSIPRGNLVQRASNGDFQVLMKQDHTELRSASAIIPNIVGTTVSGRSPELFPDPGIRGQRAGRFERRREINSITDATSAVAGVVVPGPNRNWFLASVVIGLFGIGCLILVRAIRRAGKQG